MYSRQQVLAKVPHGREEQRNAGLVTPDVGCLLADLGHEDHVLCGVETLQQDTFTIELVPEDNDKTAQCFHGVRVLEPPRQSNSYRLLPGNALPSQFR